MDVMRYPCIQYKFTRAFTHPKGNWQTSFSWLAWQMRSTLKGAQEEKTSTHFYVINVADQLTWPALHWETSQHSYRRPALTRMRLHYSLSCPAILWLTVTFNPGFRTHDLALHKTTRLKIAGHNLLDETTHSKSHGHTAEGEREGGGRARLSRTKVTQLLTTPDTPLGQSKKTT